MELTLKNKSSLIILFTPLIFLFFFTYILKNYYYHDTLVSYEWFKYIYDFYYTFGEIPLWIDSYDGGIRISYLVILFPAELSSVIMVLGKFLNISAYPLFLIYLSLLHSIFLFGLKKIISIFFPENKIFLLLFATMIQCIGINIFNEYIFSLLIYIFLPYYIYYLFKFSQNYKVQELFKITYLSLIKFFLFFHYTFFIELYVLLFLFFYLCFDRKVMLNIFNSFKNFKNVLRILPILILFLLSLLNLKVFNTFHLVDTDRMTDGIRSFQTFIGGGGGELEYFKIHSFFSNFLWGESNLIITSAGLFFLIYAFCQKKLIQNNIFKTCLIISLSLILLSYLPNYPLILKNFVGKILYNLPFMKYQFHLFYLHMFAKPLILLMLLFGLNYLLNAFETKIYKVKNSLFIFLIVNFSYFILIHKPNFYKKEIIISFIISIIFFLFIFFTTLILIKVNKKPSKKIFISLLFISIFPVAIYNFSNHSFSNDISYFKKEIPKFSKFRGVVKDKYEKIYFENKYESKINHKCLNEDEIYNQIPSTYIKEFIPRGSADYAENIINQNIYSCQKIFYTSLVENIKDYKNIPDNFLLNDSKKIEFINNQNYKLLTEDNLEKIKTNLSYSDAWEIKDEKNNILEKFNDNNFLGFYTNGSNEFELKYNNINEKLFILFKFIFGGLAYLFFIFSLFFKKKLIST